MRDGIVVAAPCKINTHLRVFDRRADGFHDIESVFQALSYGDELRLESLKERFACDVRMDGPVPPERNIVYKAVSVFRKATGFDGGLRISIEKRVPFGAGLGGGSSDAAAAILALDRLAGSALPLQAMEAIASELGSDVPFFLRGGTAFVSGRGESVRPIEARLDYSVVLVNPGFPSDTAAAYRMLDAERAAGTVHAYPELPPDRAAVSVLLAPSAWPFFNDFLPVLSHASPAYDEILSDLRKLGARFAGLSGSGSTCFGIFDDHPAAETAEKELAERWPFVKLAVPLARSDNPD